MRLVFPKIVVAVTQVQRWHDSCERTQVTMLTNPAQSAREEREPNVNVKQLVGMQVFAVDAGKNLGSVERVLFSPDDKRVQGFLVTPASGMMEEPEAQRLLEVNAIKHVGHDAITVESESVLETIADGQLPHGLIAFDEIEKEKVLTEGGDEVGSVSSIDFDGESFQIDFLEVSRGFMSGNSLINVDNVITVGPDRIVVKDAALNEPEPETTIVEDRD